MITPLLYNFKAIPYGIIVGFTPQNAIQLASSNILRKCRFQVQEHHHSKINFSILTHEHGP